jgi:hypothetical protein
MSLSQGKSLLEEIIVILQLGESHPKVLVFWFSGRIQITTDLEGLNASR